MLTTWKTRDYLFGDEYLSLAISSLPLNLQWGTGSKVRLHQLAAYSDVRSSRNTPKRRRLIDLRYASLCKRNHSCTGNPFSSFLDSKPTFTFCSHCQTSARTSRESTLLILNSYTWQCERKMKVEILEVRKRVSRAEWLRVQREACADQPASATLGVFRTSL